VVEYCIFRHGETFFTKFHLPYFWRNFSVGISPEAVPALERLAVHLKDIPSDLNICSEFKRCIQSAEIITKITGKQFRIDPRLNEYCRESFGSFRRRVMNFIDEVNQEKYHTVIICTHGAVMAGLTHLLLEGSFKQTQLFDYPRPGIIVCIKNQKMNQIDFNGN
jgi:broad specificity phosphatase PhoE